MKYLSVIPFLFLFNINYSQTEEESDKIKSYQVEFNKELEKYNSNEQVVEYSYFKEKIHDILKTVIFGNSDISTNSSSFSYTQSSDNTNITASINSNLRKDTLANNLWYLKTGIYAKGEDNIFNLYSKESWKNDVGVNLGLMWKFNSSLIFNNDKELEKNKKDRKLYVDSLISSKRNYRYDSIKYFENKLKLFENILKEREVKLISLGDFTFESDEAFTKEDKIELNKLIEKKGAKKIFDSLSTQKSKLEKYLSSKSLNKLVRKELKDFDKKNNVIAGYSLHWLDFNLSGANSTYNISNDSILTDDILLNNNLEKFKRKLKITGEINYNYTRNARFLQYFQGGISFVNGSLLDNNLVVGSPKVALDNGVYYLVDEDKNKIGTYSTLSNNNSFGSFNFYYGIFFNKKKNLGVNLTYKHNYLISRSDDAYFKNNFSFIGGPVFMNLNAEGLSKGTFGIEFGFENSEYKSRVVDDFIARIKVGLPFSIFNKKEK